MATKRVILYTRPGCHLCDEAKAAMKAANCPNAYSLEEVNIDNDADLRTKYSYDIPVITIDGVEAFRHRVDTEAFRRWILGGS